MTKRTPKSSTNKLKPIPASKKKKTTRRPRKPTAGTPGAARPRRVGTRRRRGHYITGVHNSPKSIKPIEYRSGWEQAICVYLDASPDVLSYEYECVAIPYLSNSKTGKVRLYFPDFLILYASGAKKLVEVKRADKLTDPKIMKKTEAGKKWASEHGITYELWTDKLIEQVKLVNQARATELSKTRLIVV